MRFIRSVINLIACVAFAYGLTTSEFSSIKIDRTDNNLTHNIITGWAFSTKLDHFSTQDHRQVNLFYDINLDYYVNGGPIFIYAKDVADYSNTWIDRGIMVDIARTAQGALLTMNYRYFAENIIGESADLDNLQFLTVDQIIGDFAVLITSARAQLGAADDVRVIIWGSGFGGTIAAWVRLKYPHLFTGAWSANGIFASHSTVYTHYDSLQYNLYLHGSEQCMNRVQLVFDTIEQLIENDESEVLQNRLNLCSPVNTDDPSDNAFLVERLIDFIITFVDENHANGVRSFCQHLNAIPDHALASFSRWYNFVFGDFTCYNFSYASFVEQYSQTEWPLLGNTGFRQWTYLRCTQLGIIPVSYPNSIFPSFLNEDYQIAMCQDILGPDYEWEHLDEAIASLQLIYGGLYQSIDNIVYSNGLLSPWMHHQIFFTYGNAALVNYNYHSSGADIASHVELDAYEMTMARQRIEGYIWSFLNLTVF